MSQAQPSIPRPTRLFLRQLRASHLGSELGGENFIALALPLYPGHSFSVPRTCVPSVQASSKFCFLTGTEELCCAAELDNPMQQKWTKPTRAGSEVEWAEDLAL